MRDARRHHPATDRYALRGGRAASRGVGRTGVLVVAGILAGGVLLLVVSKLDSTRSGGSGDGAPRIRNATDLVGADGGTARTPGALSDAERRASAETFTRAQLEEGAWVQVADENGRLAQQYSARSLTPLPDGELALEAPRAMLFRPDGRVIQLSADSGRARVPRQALESGTLTGHVLIRIFRPRETAPGQPAVPVDVERDRPVIEVTATDARFDQLELRCDGAISLVSDMGTFDGEGLSMILDERSGEMRSLIIDRCTKPIVFVRGDDGRTRPEGSRSATPDSAAAPTLNQNAAAAQPPSPTATQPSKPAAAAAPAPAAARFFQLDLEDEVVVTREKGGTTTTLKGDLLTAIFAMDGDAGFVEPRARAATPNPSAFPSDPVRAAGALVFAAQAAASGAPAAAGDATERITIAYTGRLLLRPAEQTLATADDVAVELRSDAGRRVRLEESRAQAVVECDRVAFRSDTDLVEAFGSADRPLTVRSPRLTASGERFWLKQLSGTGGFTGPGVVRLASGGERFAALMRHDPTLASPTALVMHDPHAADALVATVTLAAFDAAGAEPAAVAIRWTKALDLAFAGKGDGASGAPIETDGLRSAMFLGDVVAEGDGFRLSAGSLEASFASAPGGQAADQDGALERLLARGTEAVPALAERLRGDQVTGSLSARSLDLSLTVDPSGSSQPATLIALGHGGERRGGVQARDTGDGRAGERLAGQTLWTSALTVQFVAADDAAAGSTERSGQATNDLANDVAREIAAVEGRGGVQVRLDGRGSGPDAAGRSSAEPAWVYADALDGNGRTRQLAVTGEDVWVVRETIVADRLREIRFDETSRVAESAGPGRVRAFANAVAPTADAAGDGGEPPARPTLPDRQSMLVEWTKQFRFEEAAGGAIELTGDVSVRSTPDRASTDAVNAAWMRVELADADASAAAAKAGIRRIVARGAPRGGTDGAGGTSAEGSLAVFASRRWADESRSGDPRVLQLEGPDITYDLVTREGAVAGAGKLLAHVPDGVRDAAGATAADRPEQAGETTLVGRRLGFGTTGTTRFTWRDRLDLRSIGGDRFRVDLQGGVQMVHADTSGTAVPSLLTASRLEAEFERLDEAAHGATANAGVETGVDLTGTAKLLAVRGFGDGAGRVQFDTGEFVVECDAFLYDTQSQIATLTATDGRSVVVVGTNPPGRRSAESVEWNLATGTIRIRNARGS